jgi:hypothetical protein
MQTNDDLKTVAEVLEWALKHLGVEYLTGDGCACDADDILCDHPLGCYLAKQVPCDPKKCNNQECNCWDENDRCTPADFCNQPITVPRPCVKSSAPQWTTETPTEEGHYWVYCIGYNENAVSKVKVFKYDGYDRLHVHRFIRRSQDFDLASFIEFYKPTHWLKIDVPSMPE